MQRLKDRLSHNTETLGLLRYRLPVVPHKAVAEVSKIGHYRRGELLSCMDGGVVAVVAVVTTPTTAGCGVV
jgi:hypothetical protein